MSMARNALKIAFPLEFDVPDFILCSLRRAIHRQPFGLAVWTIWYSIPRCSMTGTKHRFRWGSGYPAVRNRKSLKGLNRWF